jgi:hypothetical protein
MKVYDDIGLDIFSEFFKEKEKGTITKIITDLGNGTRGFIKSFVLASTDIGNNKKIMTMEPGDTQNDKFYYTNPIIVAFMVLCHYFNDQTKIVGPVGKQRDSKKSVAFIQCYMLMLFVCEYFTKVCDQGEGIVNTLEHLKYNMLYNSSGKLALYNYNNGRPDNQKLNFVNLTNQNSYYDKIVKVKVAGVDTEIPLQERIKLGGIEQAKMIQLLMKYSTSTEKTFDVEKEDVSFGKLEKMEIVKLDPPNKCKFIMITAILRGIVKTLANDNITYDEAQHVKYKPAALATAEFAMSVSSGVGKCLGELENKCQFKSIVSKPQGGSRRIPRTRKYKRKFTRKRRGGGKKTQKHRSRRVVRKPRSKVRKSNRRKYYNKRA